MNRTIFKSIGAILAGFVLGAVLSVGTDFILDKLGIMSMENFRQTPFFIILVVIIYRFTFNVTGCYLAARLAPNKPMKHAIIMGIIGTVISLAGSISMWESAIPFYNISIIVMSMPSAWLGGYLYVKSQTRKVIRTGV